MLTENIGYSIGYLQDHALQCTVVQIFKKLVERLNLSHDTKDVSTSFWQQTMGQTVTY